LANNFRAFTVEMYRLIPHFDLRHSSGRYFDKEIAFMSMVELGWNFGPC